VQRNAYDSIKQAEVLIQVVRAAGIKLVVDTDDDFHNIDVSHPEYQRHKATLEAFDVLVAAADQIWTSTQQLATAFTAKNPHTFLVPNSLDPRLWGQRLAQRNPESMAPLRLLYMGTVSHSADFDMIFPALDTAAVKFPGSFSLTVIGVADTLPDRPWIQRIYQKRGGSLYPRFVPWLLEQGPFDIGLSPLVDSSFNRGKSDIKCLDYIGLGCVPLVSGVEAYNTPGLTPAIIRVEGHGSEWEIVLTKIISDPSAFRSEQTARLQNGRRYLQEYRSSARTAHRLAELLATL
jgi:hypothetical protein